MIKDGSRFDRDNDSCATMSRQLCPGWRQWASVTFDDGRRGWFQHQDLVECLLRVELPECKGDRKTWNAGFGQCNRYVTGRIHNFFCDRHRDDGLLAEEVCFEGGQCDTTTSLGDEEPAEP